MDRPVVVVTGAASGIGKAVAHGFSGSGAFVLGMDLRVESDAICDRLVIGDVANLEDWERCRALCVELGRLDVIVNAAGVANHGSVEELSLLEWNRILAINLTSCYLSAHTLLPLLRPTQGCIINISSTLGLIGASNLSAYCAAKAGIVNFTRALAAEVGADGVRAVCVCPGPIDTPFINGPNAGFGPLERLASRTSLGRLGTASEIAEVVQFLASGGGRYMTGTSVVVDGGRLAW